VFVLTVILLPGIIFQRKINTAYSVLGIIKRNFIYMDDQTFLLLYKSIVRPHVECANSVWCPFKLGSIEEIKKIQKRATKLIIKLKHKPYKESLIHLNLVTLKYRQSRGDMTEVFKIIHNIYTMQKHHHSLCLTKWQILEVITLNF